KNHTVSAPRPENSTGYKSITKSSVTRHAVVRAASKLMQNQSVASSPQRGVGLTVWIFTKNPGTPKRVIGTVWKKRKDARLQAIAHSAEKPLLSAPETAHPPFPGGLARRGD